MDVRADMLDNEWKLKTVGDALLVVDVQEGFINEFTRHLPQRVATLIEQDSFEPILFTRFVNTESGPYQRFIGWNACADEPETNLTQDVAVHAREEHIFTTPGYAGISGMRGSSASPSSGSIPTCAS